MKAFFVFILLLKALVLFAEENREVLRELQWYGGIATFNLTVKDECNVPVPEAKGEAWFWYRNDATRDEAYTDSEGKISLSNRAKTDGGVRITKEGYYTTQIHQSSFSAPSQPFSFWERRKWVPVTRDVVLKTKVNPIPMYSKRYRGKIPHLNQPVGFDLKVVDWVHPDGKGEVADVYITVETEVVPFGKIMQKRLSSARFWGLTFWGVLCYVSSIHWVSGLDGVGLRRRSSGLLSRAGSAFAGAEGVGIAPADVGPARGCVGLNDENP